MRNELRALQAPPRTPWIDTARGLGIILVVYGHVLRGQYHAGLLAWRLGEERPGGVSGPASVTVGTTLPTELGLI